MSHDGIQEWVDSLSTDQLRELSDAFQEIQEEVNYTLRDPGTIETYRQHGLLVLSKVLTDLLTDELEAPGQTREDVTDLVYGMAVALAYCMARIVELEQRDQA